MEKKYRLTEETRLWCGHTLHRIEALKDFGNVKQGDKGGWIEKEDNLSHEGCCWVYDNALVSDYAIVRDNAKVHGNAWVYDYAIVCDKAVVCDNAWVYDYAIVRNNAIVRDNAKVHGNAQVHGVMRLRQKQFTIKTMNDVVAFFSHVMFGLGIDINPEDSFKDVTDKDGKRTMSDEDAERYDKTIEDCFKVCEENGRDLYQIFFRMLGLYSYANDNELLRILCDKCVEC